MTILQNRAKISQAEQEETENRKGLRKHIPISIVKEIIISNNRGWDPSRISKDYKVDPSVIKKLEKYYAIPKDNADGIVSPPTSFDF